MVQLSVRNKQATRVEHRWKVPPSELVAEKVQDVLRVREPQDVLGFLRPVRGCEQEDKIRRTFTKCVGVLGVDKVPHPCTHHTLHSMIVPFSIFAGTASDKRIGMNRSRGSCRLRKRKQTSWPPVPPSKKPAVASRGQNPGVADSARINPF